jgi:manganese oxidase
VVPYSGTDLSHGPEPLRAGRAEDDPADHRPQRPAARQRHPPRVHLRPLERHRRAPRGRSRPTAARGWGWTRAGSRPRRSSPPGRPQGGFDGTGANGDDSLGTIEIWQIVNGGKRLEPPGARPLRGGRHPEARRQDPPEWEKWARKDVYRIGTEDDSTDSVEIAIRFREFAGTYMEHCHNTQHEDHAMLLRWDIEHPGQVKLMPAPIPTWDGVEYVDSARLPTFGRVRAPVRPVSPAPTTSASRRPSSRSAISS